MILHSIVLCIVSSFIIYYLLRSEFFSCNVIIFQIFIFLHFPPKILNFAHFFLHRQSIFKKRNLRVTICGKTSKRIKEIAKGGGEMRKTYTGSYNSNNNNNNNNNSNNSSSSSSSSSNAVSGAAAKKRSFVTYNGAGGNSTTGKRDGQDDKDNKRAKPSFAAKPAFTSRKLEPERKMGVNETNANKRINLKVCTR